jgi:hypothetical protein
VPQELREQVGNILKDIYNKLRGMDLKKIRFPTLIQKYDQLKKELNTLIQNVKTYVSKMVDGSFITQIEEIRIQK